ncbi:MAG: phosphatase PAP2-related protein [Candidatus Moraniibacteriota bacterium]
MLAHALNFFAAQYATVMAGPSIPDTFDFFLAEKYSDLRVLATAIHLEWATFLITPLFVYGTIFYPKKMIHFLILDILLVIFRAFAINLTHLGKVIGQPVITGRDYTFGGDLFFSGHVAYTFLFFLIFRDTPVKYPVLIFHLIIMIATVIGRFHYAIDVVAAYAIAYSMYKFGVPRLERFLGAEKPILS